MAEIEVIGPFESHTANTLRVCSPTPDSFENRTRLIRAEAEANGPFKNDARKHCIKRSPLLEPFQHRAH